jgi:hypothetical protein
MILADLDSIKVIGKGNCGTVQLVHHKWTGQFFALKVLLPEPFPVCFYIWEQFSCQKVFQIIK